MVSEVLSEVVYDMVRFTCYCLITRMIFHFVSVEVSHLILPPLCCPHLHLVEAVNLRNVFDTRQSFGLSAPARTKRNKTTLYVAANLFKQRLQRGKTGCQKADGDFGRRPEGWRGISICTAL